MGSSMGADSSVGLRCGSNPGWIALKNAFCSNLPTTSQRLIRGRFTRPEIGTTVATSPRGRFLKDFRGDSDHAFVEPTAESLLGGPRSVVADLDAAE